MSARQTSLQRRPFWCQASIDDTLTDVNEYFTEVLAMLDRYLVTDFDFGNNLPFYFKSDSPCFCEGNLPPNLNVVKEIEGGKTGSVMIVEQDGVFFVVKKIRASIPEFLTLRRKDVSDTLKLISHAIHNNIVLVGNKEQYLVSSNNNYVNQTLISLMVRKILSQKFPYGYAHQIDAFHCQRDGYQILEYANKGTLFDYLTKLKITDKNIRIILRKIFRPLAELKKYGFNHNDLKCKNILVDRQNKKNYYLLSDFDKSSIFYNGCYYHPAGTVNYPGDYLPTFERDENGTKFLVYNLRTVSQRILGGAPALQLYTMYSDKPFYETLDFYTFFFTFFAHEKVYAHLQSNQDGFLWELLRFLWIHQQDRNTFLRKLGELKGTESGQSLSRILVHFASNDLYFRSNTQDFFDFLDIPFNNTLTPERYKQTYTVTKNKQLCLDDCVDICQTNAYTITSGYGFGEDTIYTADNCS